MKINTTQAVADSLGISPRRVRKLIAEMGIPTERIGKAIVLSDAQVRMLGKRKTERGPLPAKRRK